MGSPMGGIGIGATLASGFISAAGDIFQGKAQQKMQQYQAGLALQRANIADLNSQLAIQQGGEQSMEAGIRGGQAIGQQRAGMAAGNIDVNTGSAARVTASQRWGIQTTESNIQTEAARKAYGFQVQKATDIGQAGADIAAGETARTAGEISATTSILSSLAGVSSKWAQAGQAGLGGDALGSSTTDPTMLSALF